MRQIKLGQATVTVINLGDIYLPLAGYLGVPETDLASRRDLHGLADQTTLPILGVHIQLPHTSLLVDAGIYDVETDPDYALPDYTPPPALVDQLLEAGIGLDTIEHVIITHRHWDHFNGTTHEVDGQILPRFPNATYYLGRPDWERAEQPLQDPNSLESRTLKVLHQRGVLQLVDGDVDVVAGITIFAAPGETRGHQIVRVQSESETLYCLGDLYHHPVEFTQPDLKVSWANAETIMASRQALTTRALDENALLVATHIPAIGRLRATAKGVDWETVFEIE